MKYLIDIFTIAGLATALLAACALVMGVGMLIGEALARIF